MRDWLAAPTILAVPLLLAAPARAATGPQNFASHCSMCHQADGAGLPGQFPRLAGRIGPIAASPEGRHYLISVVLTGMYGKIVVDGQPISGLMPSMGMMSDKDVADVLNHVVALKKPAKPVAAFTAAEVAKIRAEGKRTSSDVGAERTRIDAKKLIP
jgi:mono/diheme cytochrome c family protein